MAINSPDGLRHAALKKDNMSRIAFLTMDSLEGFVSYDYLVRDILQQRGLRVDEISWRDPRADWDQYELVVIRSPWDYQQSCSQFLDVLARIDASRASLQNPLKVVRWNVEKTYLRDLQDSGVTIVPTAWLQSPRVADLTNLFQQLKADQVVVKPFIGAGATDTFWLNVDSSPELLQSIEVLYQGRLALAQPFIESVLSYGEISLTFFGGEYSHTVLKTPKSGDFRVQEEHGGIIQPIDPDPEVIAFARRSLAAVQSDLLYARVDLVFLENQQPAIMELELIEPSLYLSYDDESPKRFAGAVEARL
jgi:glutathione synthase/RimK-type ligase-like ATP-grasp enzyme